MHSASSPGRQQNKLTRMIVSGVALLVIAGYIIYASGIGQVAKDWREERIPRKVDAELAQRHYRAAVDAIHADHDDAAASELTSAIETDPAFADAWFQRGMLMMRVDRDKGIADFSKVIELKGDSPAYADVYFFRGSLYEAKGMLEETVADYTSYLNAPAGKRVPNPFYEAARSKAGKDAWRLTFSEAFVLHSRGLVYLRLDKVPEATDDFLQALSLDRDHALYFIQPLYPALQKKFQALPEGETKTRLKDLLEQIRSQKPEKKIQASGF